MSILGKIMKIQAEYNQWNVCMRAHVHRNMFGRELTVHGNIDWEQNKVYLYFSNHCSDI